MINVLQHLQQTAIRVLKDEPLRSCEKNPKSRNDPRNLPNSPTERTPKKPEYLRTTTSSWQPNEHRTPKTWEFMNFTYDKYFPLGSMCMFLCDVSKNIYSSSFMLFRGFWRYLLHLDGFFRTQVRWAQCWRESFESHRPSSHALLMMGIKQINPTRSGGVWIFRVWWFSEILAA